MATRKLSVMASWGPCWWPRKSPRVATDTPGALAGSAASVMPMCAHIVPILIQRRQWPEPSTPARPIRDSNGRTERSSLPVRRALGAG